MNWLCRIVGHKWITYKRGRKDGKRVLWQTIWPCCIRCGSPTPDDLVLPENVELREPIELEELRIMKAINKETSNGKA